MIEPAEVFMAIVVVLVVVVVGIAVVIVVDVADYFKKFGGGGGAVESGAGANGGKVLQQGSRRGSLGPSAMNRIEFKQMRGAFDAALGFIHMNEGDIVARPAGPQRQPTHAAETIDPYSQGHPIFLPNPRHSQHII